MVREILVIKRDKLFKDSYFSGFTSVEDNNYLNLILENFEYKERNDELETNADYKQVVSYIWIVNPETKKVFVYKRAPDQRYTEARLRNKFSCGIGGHIDRDTEGDATDPIHSGMIRELQEEVAMESYSEPKVIGFVTLDNKNVEHYHLGIVSLLETTQSVEKKDEEVAETMFLSIEEVDNLFADAKNDIEIYTQLSWSAVKSYLQSKN